MLETVSSPGQAQNQKNNGEKKSTPQVDSTHTLHDGRTRHGAPGAGHPAWGFTLIIRTLWGSSTASLLEMATKRSLFDNARRGIAPPPCAWSIEMGQCSRTWRPPGAVSPSRKRDQEAARSNRRESLVSVPVTSQWCAQEAADQAARTRWPPGRQHGRGPS